MQYSNEYLYKVAYMRLFNALMNLGYSIKKIQTFTLTKWKMSRVLKI